MKLFPTRTVARRAEPSPIGDALYGDATFGGTIRCEMHSNTEFLVRPGDTLLLELSIHPTTGIAGIVRKP